jgi:hypothetical protein
MNRASTGAWFPQSLLLASVCRWAKHEERHVLRQAVVCRVLLMEATLAAHEVNRVALPSPPDAIVQSPTVTDGIFDPPYMSVPSGTGDTYYLQDGSETLAFRRIL